jgi:hypothetical protein
VLKSEENMNSGKITLSFTVAEVNIILASLGKQPYEVVNELLNSISAEARRQFVELETKANSDDKPE